MFRKEYYDLRGKTNNKKVAVRKWLASNKLSHLFSTKNKQTTNGGKGVTLSVLGSKGITQ